MREIMLAKKLVSTSCAKNIYLNKFNVIYQKIESKKSPIHRCKIFTFDKQVLKFMPFFCKRALKISNDNDINEYHYPNLEYLSEFY